MKNCSGRDIGVITFIARFSYKIVYNSLYPSQYTDITKK